MLRYCTKATYFHVLQGLEDFVVNVPDRSRHQTGLHRQKTTAFVMTAVHCPTQDMAVYWLRHPGTHIRNIQETMKKIFGGILVIQALLRQMNQRQVCNKIQHFHRTLIYHLFTVTIGLRLKVTQVIIGKSFRYYLNKYKAELYHLYSRSNVSSIDNTNSQILN